jgi:hypothetical protein
MKDRHLLAILTTISSLQGLCSVVSVNRRKIFVPNFILILILLLFSTCRDNTFAGIVPFSCHLYLLHKNSTYAGNEVLRTAASNAPPLSLLLFMVSVPGSCNLSLSVHSEPTTNCFVPAKFGCKECSFVLCGYDGQSKYTHDALLLKEHRVRSSPLSCAVFALAEFQQSN